VNHLTSEQLSEWIAGARLPEHEQHIRECAECAEAVGHAGELFADFSEAYRQWGERQFVSPPQASWERPRSWLGRAAFAAGIIAILLAIPGTEWIRHRQQTARIAMEDDALLTAIQSDVARTVPASLKPLAELSERSAQ
jgi:hypothetical protein